MFYQIFLKLRICHFILVLFEQKYLTEQPNNHISCKYRYIHLLDIASTGSTDIFHHQIERHQRRIELI